MSPLSFLIFLVALTLAARLINNMARRKRGRIVRRLAAEWRMNYTPGDSLQVTPRIVRYFPIPGAANLLIRDLIYGIELLRRRSDQNAPSAGRHIFRAAKSRTALCE